MMLAKNKILILVLGVLVTGCGGSSTEETKTTELPATEQPIIDTNTVPENNTAKNREGDISYLTLSNRNPDCEAYVGNYLANIFDLQTGTMLASYLTVTSTETSCIFISNNIPNHDLGGNTTTGKDFATTVRANTNAYTLTIPRNPTKLNAPIYIEKIAGMLTLNGILLNGVDLDMDSAFCYHPDINADLNIGLGSRQQCGLNADWYAIPANNPEIVTLDEFTGHSFDGRYHYHGDNHSLSHIESEETLSFTIDDIDPSGSPVIGFAPDGFPIYGHYIYDENIKALRKVKSSWQTYTTERVTPENSTIPAPSITTHPRGIFVEDWNFVAGSGDLDECNGMTDVYGNYGYYYTEDYPFGPICNFGSPDSSFTLDSSAFIGD